VDDTPVFYNPEARDRIRRAVLYVEGLNRGNGLGRAGAAQRPSIEWLPFANKFAGTIPAFAIMKVTGGTDAGTETGGTPDPSMLMLQCNQADSTFSRSWAINGPEDVPQNEYGACHRSPVHCQVLYDTGTPTAGDGYGPKAGQWSLSKNYPSLFVVDYPNDTSNKIMLGQFGTINSLIGKCGAAISKGGSGYVTIWTGPGGSESATSWSVLAYANGAAITASKWVTVDYVNGVPYVGPWEC
jgi:hypothetical protein